MSLEKLLENEKQITALGQVAGLISWDQEAMMPPKGAGQRAEQAGALAQVIHDRRTDPRIGDWLAEIDGKQLSEFDRCNVHEIRRAYDRATKVPARLASEIAMASSQGQQSWVAARKTKNLADFLPALKRNIELKREEAACISGSNDPQSLYDALLDEFEPGARTSELSALLESMRPRLKALREKIAEKPAPAALKGHFPADQQLVLASKLATTLGYDFEAGRIDKVVHPFCSGSGNDVRITTRTDEADPFNCLYSTIHEVGHALYSQGITDPFLPAAEYSSMGVHESQSRFWENQIARSGEFAKWLFPAMVEAFGAMNIESPDALYAAVNRVETGYIRTEADEVHYNLHILLRFELERDLICGALEAEDLEEAWNANFERDFGLKVDDPNLGVMQDVHWSAGLFGYFPTYSLGNIYAACLNRAMRKDLPNRDKMVENAETAPILNWLREKIHVKGRLYPAPKLIEQATGEAPSTEPLLDYLETKFGGLYDL